MSRRSAIRFRHGCEPCGICPACEADKKDHAELVAKRRRLRSAEKLLARAASELIDTFNTDHDGRHTHPITKAKGALGFQIQRFLSPKESP